MISHDRIRDIRELWEEVKENRRKLDSCKVHDFGKLPEEFTPSRRFVCKNCGGAMTVCEVMSYASGYRAAGGDPNNILKGVFNNDN